MESEDWSDYHRVAFSLLSPLCKDVIKQPNEENLLKLKNSVDKLLPEPLQMYQRYICIPLCVSLVKKEVGLEVKRHVVDTLAKILIKTKLNDFDLFFKIYSEIFRIISDTSGEKTVTDCSEELKLSVMDCARVLIANASTEVLSEFYTEKYLPSISHGIYFCLHIIKFELFLDLRISALKCLMHICHANNDFYSGDVKFRAKVSDILMHCLPGIIYNLSKAICVDEKQNHRVTMLAIKAWSRITAIVMEDNLSYEISEPIDDWVTAQLDLISFVEKSKEKTERDTKDRDLSVLRSKQKTKEWYACASKNMLVIVDDICHSHFLNWKVRKEMVLAAEILLLNCSRNMKVCVPSLVEMLLILSEDEETYISEKSRLVLSKFSNKIEKSLVEIMEEHFLKVMKKLGTVTQGEEALKIHLNMICGYLKLLGNNLKRITKSSVHLNTISSALIQMISLDYFIVSPLDDWTLGTNDADILKSSIPWKCFKNFKDKQIYSKFKKFCQLLKQYSDLSTISDHFLINFLQDQDDRKEIILILNEIFSFESLSDSDVEVSIVKRIINSYLDPEIWEDIKVEDSETSINNYTVADIRSRTVQACLLVEGLGMIGRIAISEKLKFYSLDVWFFRMCLYPILERIGHSCPMVSGAGTLAMAHISHAAELPIPTVIQNNSDYLTHHIVLKLHHASEFKSSAPLHVLAAILQFGTAEIINNLEEVVTNVVSYGLKYESNMRTHDCLKCMYLFTKFVRNKCTREENKMSDVGKKLFLKNYETDMQVEKRLGVVTHRLLEYQRTRKSAGNFIGQSNNFDDESKDSEENGSINHESEQKEDVENTLPEDPKQPLPKHVDLTIIVMKQCLTFLSSVEKERKLMALDILSEGIWVVSDYNKELLPLVHQIWGPLSVQFNNMNPLVMDRAFHLLSIIAVVARDFIRSRTLKKVLPSVSKFLLKQANSSIKKDSKSVYRFSHEYRLQLSLLQGLGKLSTSLEFQEQDLSEVLTSTAPYLNCLQPKPFQDACMSTYEEVSRINQDVVWLKLAYMGNLFQHLKPPSAKFKVYEMPKQTEFGEEYQQNVSRLIQCIGCNKNVDKT